MMRTVFYQAPSWDQRQHCAYSDAHCCYCGREVKPDAPKLMLSRTNDGEWWLCDPGEPPMLDEVNFGGRFALPVGIGCLKRHPEWRFALVTKKSGESA